MVNVNEIRDNTNKVFTILKRYNADTIIKLQYSYDDRVTYNMVVIKDVYVVASLDDNRILRLAYDRLIWHREIICAKAHFHVTEPDIKYEIMADNAEKYVTIEENLNG